MIEINLLKYLLLYDTDEAWNSFHLIIRVRYCGNIFYRDDNRDKKAALNISPLYFEMLFYYESSS